jgi:hypothetical protein
MSSAVKCGVPGCRYNVEPDPSQALPAAPEHHLVLQDFVLEKPRAGEDGICRRRYDRTGDQRMEAPGRPLLAVVASGRKLWHD